MDHFENISIIFLHIFKQPQCKASGLSGFCLLCFSYTSHWSLGLRRVFITNECLMSAWKSLLSDLGFLVAVLWKDLHVEKGPVEH